MLHTSNLAYGEWIIEYLLPKQTDKIYTSFFFIFNKFGDENFDGFIRVDKSGYLNNISGYALIITGSRGAENWFSKNATLLLIRIDPSKISLEKGLLLTSPWESNNGILGVFNNFPNLILPEKLSIKIIRDVDGNFKVYYNFELIFNVIDNTYNSSQSLVLGSWSKSHYIDNITVNETINKPSKTVYAMTWLILSTIVVYSIIRRKSK
jgi:hypothetical protein